MARIRRKPVHGRKAKKWRKEVEKLRMKFQKHLGTSEGDRVLEKLRKANNAYHSALEGQRFSNT
jgi:hypothetical protein